MLIQVQKDEEPKDIAVAKDIDRENERFMKLSKFNHVINRKREMTGMNERAALVTKL